MSELGRVSWGPTSLILVVSVLGSPGMLAKKDGFGASMPNSPRDTIRANDLELQPSFCPYVILPICMRPLVWRG